MKVGNNPKGVTAPKVLDFIITFIIDNGCSPTIREIGNGVGITLRAVHYQVAKLATKGLLQVKANQSRGISLPNQIILAFSPEEMECLRKESAISGLSVGGLIKECLKTMGCTQKC